MCEGDSLDREKTRKREEIMMIFYNISNNY